MHLLDFRNYGYLELAIPPGVSLFFGSNAEGKTNLLEGCYYLSTLTSPRAERELDLAMWGKERFAVGGRLAEADGDTSYIKIETQLTPSLRRRISIDDAPAKRPELTAKFPCVYFSPDDLYMVKRGSAQRRRLLDSLLSRLDPLYAKQLSRYEDALTRRNSALKKAFANPGWEGALKSLGEILISSGADVVRKRLGLMATFAHQVSDTYRFISGDECEVDYFCSLGQTDPSGGTVEDMFEKRLDELAGEERARGVTLVGPHRDDLVVTFGGKTVRYFGSQGEQRSVALALRMAEAKALESKFGKKPTLLLDDVFSELDERRRRKVLSLCEYGHQILLTSTDPVPRMQEIVHMFKVVNGTVTPS